MLRFSLLMALVSSNWAITMDSDLYFETSSHSTQPTFVYSWTSNEQALKDPFVKMRDTIDLNKEEYCENFQAVNHSKFTKDGNRDMYRDNYGNCPRSIEEEIIGKGRNGGYGMYYAQDPFLTGPTMLEKDPGYGSILITLQIPPKLRIPIIKSASSSCWSMRGILTESDILVYKWIEDYWCIVVRSTGAFLNDDDWTIRSKTDTSFCLNARRVKHGEPVELSVCKAAKTEQFQILGDGTIRPLSDTSLCFKEFEDVLLLWTCSYASDELFLVEGDRIRGKNDNTCLHVNAVSEGEVVKIEQCDKAEGSNEFQWAGSPKFTVTDFRPPSDDHYVCKSLGQFSAPTELTDPNSKKFSAPDFLNKWKDWVMEWKNLAYYKEITNDISFVFGGVTASGYTKLMEAEERMGCNKTGWNSYNEYKNLDTNGNAKEFIQGLKIIMGQEPSLRNLFGHGDWDGKLASYPVSCSSGSISGSTMVFNPKTGKYDAGLENVEVTLTSATGVLRKTRTDENGVYSFTKLPVARYVVKQTQPILYESAGVMGSEPDAVPIENIIEVELSEGEVDEDNVFREKKEEEEEEEEKKPEEEESKEKESEEKDSEKKEDEEKKESNISASSARPAFGVAAFVICLLLAR